MIRARHSVTVAFLLASMVVILFGCLPPPADEHPAELLGPSLVYEASEGLHSGDQLGYAVTTGDLDMNGYDDAIIGAPGYDGDTGIIHVVLFGENMDGELITSHYTFGKEAMEELGHPEYLTENDEFGAAVLVTGHDPDGMPGLYVGSPGQRADCGAVYALYGTRAEWEGDIYNFRFTGVDRWILNFDQCPQYQTSRFGSSLASAPLFNTLFVGAPDEDLITGPVSAGGVYTIDKWDPSISDNPTGPFMIDDITTLPQEENAHLGYALDVADYQEATMLTPDRVIVAIGAPGESDGRHGTVVASVFRDDGTWHAPLSWSSVRSLYGNDVALGQFDCTDFTIDLAVGSPDGRSGGRRGAGEVQVIYNIYYWGPGMWEHIETVTEPINWAVVERYDRFGWSVAAAAVNDGDVDDLLVSAPHDEMAGENNRTGFLFYLRGQPDQYDFPLGSIHHSSLLWDARKNDRFGRAFEVGDFNNDTLGDYVVGAPTRRSSHGGYGIFLSGSRDMSAPRTGTWTGDQYETSSHPECTPDFHSTISLNFYEHPLSGEIEGWAYNTTNMELHYDYCFFGPGLCVDGCLTLYPPSPCTGDYLRFSDGYDDSTPDAQRFVVWTDFNFNVPGYPSFNIHVPLRFRQNADGTWTGRCANDISGQCGEFGLTFRINADHLDNHYTDIDEFCVEGECN